MGFSFIRKTASTSSSTTGALVAANSLQPERRDKGVKAERIGVERKGDFMDNFVVLKKQ
jgi:hypothetical protein